MTGTQMNLPTAFSLPSKSHGIGASTRSRNRRAMSLGVERCKDQTNSDFKIKSNSPGKTWCVLAEAIIYAN